MTIETIKEVTKLVQEGYNLYAAFKKSNDAKLFDQATKNLELADAMIHASTKPKYFPTGEGWDLMLVNSPNKDELNPPTEASILEWFKARSLA